jgi:Tol biopolymer transport system component
MLKTCVAFFLSVTFSQINAQSKTTTDLPTLFLEGVISTNLNERDMAISPDGQDMYYTLLGNQNVFSTIIHREKLSNNKWSAPTVASFSGNYGDLEPAFSPDGKKLFFSSNRPITGNEPKDYDIWVTENINGNWSEPKNLGVNINTKANEFYPSVAANGNLYFTAEYDKGPGKEDIYVSRWINGSFTKSAALDSAINSDFWEFNAFVSPDETFIIFTSYGRKDDMGGGDLYLSVKDAKNQWQPAQNLVLINSTKLDYCPFVTADQKTLYFTSKRHNLPSSYAKDVTFEELVRAYNGASNGSDDIYETNFERLLESSKK